MNASALLAELQGRGVQVEVTGGQLQFDAPRGALADLLPEIARFKPALMELLTNEADEPQTPVLSVARGPDDASGQAVEAMFNRHFDAREILEYNRAIDSPDRCQAPHEVTSAARARGVAVTSYGWPVCYWPGDYTEELKAARSRKENHL